MGQTIVKENGAPESGPKFEVVPAPMVVAPGRVAGSKDPYTLREAAIKLRRSEKTIRRLIDRRHLRRDKTFGRVLIYASDVDNFFDKHCR
jgi:excisionase family DNA binding protein